MNAADKMSSVAEKSSAAGPARVVSAVRAAIADEERLDEPFHRGRVHALRWVLDLIEDSDNDQQRERVLAVRISGAARERLEIIRGELCEASGEAAAIEYAASIALILGSRMLAGTSQRPDEDRHGLEE